MTSLSHPIPSTPSASCILGITDPSIQPSDLSSPYSLVIDVDSVSASRQFHKLAPKLITFTHSFPLLVIGSFSFCFFLFFSFHLVPVDHTESIHHVILHQPGPMAPGAGTGPQIRTRAHPPLHRRLAADRPSDQVLHRVPTKKTKGMCDVYAAVCVCCVWPQQV